MKRIVLLSVLAIAAIVIYSCRKDITITPPPSLSGDYEGYYLIQRGNTPPESMCVAVRFTQDNFLLYWDSLLCELPRIACDQKGSYELASNLSLIQPSVGDSANSIAICDRERAVHGQYVVDQSTEGKVVLESQLGSGDTYLYRKLNLDLVN